MITEPQTLTNEWLKGALQYLPSSIEKKGACSVCLGLPRYTATERMMHIFKWAKLNLPYLSIHNLPLKHHSLSSLFPSLPSLPSHFSDNWTIWQWSETLSAGQCQLQVHKVWFIVQVYLWLNAWVHLDDASICPTTNWAFSLKVRRSDYLHLNLFNENTLAQCVCANQFALIELKCTLFSVNLSAKWSINCSKCPPKNKVLMQIKDQLQFKMYSYKLTVTIGKAGKPIITHFQGQLN